jgi:cyclohexanone monooxygenase
MAETQERDHLDAADHLDAVIIGAGFAGLYMLYRLRRLGLSVRVYERGDGVGGTWYWNELEQEWHWTERYPGQAEILSYLNHVADRFDLRRDIRFGCEVVQVAFDETAERWMLSIEGAAPVTATYCITAVGCLSTANRPSLAGLDRFEGPIHHTGAWPPGGVDLAAQRVGIIGTGASGIQAIPVIAEEAAHLTVFQRTPNFTIPAQNRPLDPDEERQWKADYREWRRKARESRAGIPFPRSESSALDATVEERTRTFEAAWGTGGFMFTAGTYGDLLTSEEANRTVSDFVRAKIDEIVADPLVAATLKPTTYPLGTKRLPLDTNYYETFNRANVTLVDLRANPITEVTPNGLRAGGVVHELDVIVFATGFDALTGPLFALDIRGRSGRRLDDKWAEGPKTYLGLATAGFPNLFTITGPGSPSVLTNMPVAIEQHVEWISDCIAALRADGVLTIEANEEAEEAWTAHVNEVAALTLYPRAASWYMGANIPGKPRIFMPYIGGVDVYTDKCNAVAAHGYEGFRLSAPVH